MSSRAVVLGLEAVMPNTDNNSGDVYARISIGTMYSMILETRDTVRDMQAAQLQVRRIWAWLGGGTGALSIILSLTAFVQTLGG